MFSSSDNNSLLRPINITVVSEASQSQSPSSMSVSKERGAAVAVQVQWGEEETKELIRIRGEVETDATVEKRKKALWEIVSTKIRERGFLRTPDQCKCKWKNLVNRYKGKETSHPDNDLHCPFFEELHAVFAQRAKTMQRLLLESEAASTRPKKAFKRPITQERSSDDLSEDYEDEDDDGPPKTNLRKRKADQIASKRSSRVNATDDIQDMLKEFFHQQQQMEMQWRQMMERRAHEQLEFEQEWRQTMERIERERLMAEQAWREREEQRRIREENRAERRDALLTALLNKLIHENDMQGRFVSARKS